jgi:hypothetical protein
LATVRAWTSEEAREVLVQATPEDRAAWLAGLQQIADAVAAATITATDVFDIHGDGQVLHGASTTQTWLRGALRLTSGEATARVQLGRASRGVLGPAVDKLRDGELTSAHLRTIDHGVRQVPTERQPEAAELLTELAEVAPVSAVRTAAQHLAHVVDPDGSLAASEQRFDRRYLTLAPLMDGMTALDGLLDPEAAALLNTALQPFLTPTDPDDHRTAAQRRADGLVQIVDTAAAHRLLPVAGAERPHLHVVVDPRTLTGVLPHTPGGPSAVHPTSVARIACDSQTPPLLLDAHGVVTDLGRTHRLFSSPQRRLLAARDAQCRWPGCTRPPAHTDAHHIRSWLDGGTTDVTNGLLLCRHHHRTVHEGHWTITTDDPVRGANGPVTFHGPRHQQLTSDPRGP